MNGMDRFGDECAAGQTRRDNGIRMAAFGIVVFLFGILVPVSPNVTPVIGFALIVAATLMIVSGRLKTQRAVDGLVRELQER